MQEEKILCQVEIVNAPLKQVMVKAYLDKGEIHRTIDGYLYDILETFNLLVEGRLFWFICESKLGGFGVRVEKYIPSLEDMKEVQQEFPH